MTTLEDFDVVFSFFLLETSQATLIKPSRERFFLPPPSSSRIILELFTHYLFEDEMKLNNIGLSRLKIGSG